MLTLTDPSMIVADPDIRDHLIEQRRAAGHDRYDEVWEGTYVIMPLPTDEHQHVTTALATIFQTVLGWIGAALVRAGVNVSDRLEGWKENYRCPDVAVFLKETRAINDGTHWLGGPDFGVEIRSPDNRTYEKLEFYAKVLTRELLVVGRDPWTLELYRLQGDGWNETQENER
ncbi:MAG: Uma2 family endonuclease [Planctomycetes bacterium]|nr:Uma2 family endonuclease [Planctomycetota bacterium]